MWSKLLEKHGLAGIGGDKRHEISPSRERYEIREFRGNNKERNLPPTPPPRPKRETQFPIQYRKGKETTIRKSFSVFLQVNV